MSDDLVNSGATIDCRRFVELVTGYLEGALDHRLTALVESHLDLCSPCITYLDQMRYTVASLNRLPLAAMGSTSTDELVTIFRTARGS